MTSDYLETLHFTLGNSCQSHGKTYGPGLRSWASCSHRVLRLASGGVTSQVPGVVAGVNLCGFQPSLAMSFRAGHL